MKFEAAQKKSADISVKATFLGPPLLSMVNYAPLSSCGVKLSNILMMKDFSRCQSGPPIWDLLEEVLEAEEHLEMRLED